MLMLQQTTKGHASESSGRQPTFSWRQVIKDCLYFVAIAILLGGLLNYSLLRNAFNGTLIPKIQQNQLVNLRSKAKQLYGISVIELVSAKQLYDEKSAIFVDARTAQEYEIGHISGAISVPDREFLMGEIDPGKILPNKDAVLITYCDGGECELALDVANGLSDRGYNNVFVLVEGYPGWEAAGYPVDK
jgi:rhodanese-related sulfurtransferase